MSYSTCVLQLQIIFSKGALLIINRGPYHIETSVLIWTGFYMIWTPVMKELSMKYNSF